MKKYYANKTCLGLIRVLLLFLAIGLCYASYYFLSFLPVVMISLNITVCITYVLYGLIYLPLFFTKSYYLISNQEVIKHCGLFIEVNQLMKVSAIQYITILSTPFSKYTGMNFIIINALGGRIVLYFVSKKDADEIYASLYSAIKSQRANNITN